jgi:hypothetical protein
MSVIVPELAARIEHSIRRRVHPIRVVMRGDIFDAVTLHKESEGQTWNHYFAGLPCIVMDITDEYEIECEAADLTGEDE